MKTDIKICPSCSNPLIWTFMNSGSEWFCMNCQWDGGMFSAERTDSTKKLKEKLKADTREFNKHYKYIFIGGGYLSKGCVRCDKGISSHGKHLTDKQKIKQTKAMKALKI